MNIGRILPSGRFSVILGSLVLSVMLIGGAQYLVDPEQTRQFIGISKKNTLVAVSDGASSSGWKEQFSSNEAFETQQSITEQTKKLIGLAKTSNLTKTVGRSIVIGGTAAAGQGVAGTESAEAQIIQEALAQIEEAERTPDAYGAGVLVSVEETSETLHDFGNVLALAIARHPLANYGNTMVAVGLAVDQNDSATLSQLPIIAGEYRALAKDITEVPTPQSLVPFAVQAANNYVRMAQAVDDMRSSLSDPLRGLSGIQRYNALNNDMARVYAYVASTFQNKAILFQKGEAGTVWGVFLSAAKSYETSSGEDGAHL